jgi:hypothetical protein
MSMATEFARTSLEVSTFYSLSSDATTLLCTSRDSDIRHFSYATTLLLSIGKAKYCQSGAAGALGGAEGITSVLPGAAEQTARMSSGGSAKFMTTGYSLSLHSTPFINTSREIFFHSSHICHLGLDCSSFFFFFVFSSL